MILIKLNVEKLEIYNYKRYSLTYNLNESIYSFYRYVHFEQILICALHLTIK